jgi:hypothetical protein
MDDISPIVYEIFISQQQPMWVWLGVKAVNMASRARFSAEIPRLFAQWRADLAADIGEIAPSVFKHSHVITGGYLLSKIQSESHDGDIDICVQTSSYSTHYKNWDSVPIDSTNSDYFDFVIVAADCSWVKTSQNTHQVTGDFIHRKLTHPSYKMIDHILTKHTPQEFIATFDFGPCQCSFSGTKLWLGDVNSVLMRTIEIKMFDWPRVFAMLTTYRAELQIVACGPSYINTLMSECNYIRYVERICKYISRGYSFIFHGPKSITIVSTVEQFHAAGLVKFIEERFTECAHNIQQDISVYQTIAVLNDVD